MEEVRVVPQSPRCQPSLTKFLTWRGGIAVEDRKAARSPAKCTHSPAALKSPIRSRPEQGRCCRRDGTSRCKPSKGNQWLWNVRRRPRKSYLATHRGLQPRVDERSVGIVSRIFGGWAFCRTYAVIPDLLACDTPVLLSGTTGRRSTSQSLMHLSRLSRSFNNHIPMDS